MQSCLGLYIENNIIIDSRINSKKGGELSLALTNIANMLNILDDNQKVITIFDRCYI